MRRSSVKEYVEALRGKYRKAGRREKGRMLTEFMEITGYHRKSAIRVLGMAAVRQRGGGHGRPRAYGPEVVHALKVVWEAAGRICSKRLAPFLPELVSVLEWHGELVLPAEVKEPLLAMSASTIDRLLRPFRQQPRGHGISTTRPGTLLKTAIPIRTFSEWDERKPGFLEIDLVAHCGVTAEGFYLNTLTTVDIATGWVEVQGVWGKGQDRVGSAIHGLRQRLPFPLLGLDSDNGSEFINQHLYTYCLREHITFTRSRPYKKNDSAHVEQKNGNVVRRLVGYDRYTTREALEQLNGVYRILRLYLNFFQPVLQLQAKHRAGARVQKTYDTARTPYQRLLESEVLNSQQKAALRAHYARLNPVQLKAELDRGLTQLWARARMEPQAPSVTPISEATTFPSVTLSIDATRISLISQDFRYRSMASFGVSILMPIWGRVVL